jgi:2-polyprenyl-6-methoxyphenol hydroxylase-like FAD-dependent oxidoreductase
MSRGYDVIVVGARCAGSPTAMLLARKGYRVLVVDRATFPSDTISSHIIQPPGVAALARWGLLDRLAATGCPPLRTFAFDFGPVSLAGAPGRADSPVAYCPRRTVLDKLLVDAAAEAGAEIREAFSVQEILVDKGRVAGVKGTADGHTVEERAEVVIGADGWHSRVAEAVHPQRYNEKPPLSVGYYSYWSELPVEGRFEIHIRPHRAFGVAPTHDGLTLVIGGWPYSEFAANKDDVEGNFAKMLELVPEFAERVRGARREARFAGGAQPNYFCRPYGPGWALVGDAGYVKDPITAQGIADAFLDAERLAEGLDAVFRRERPFDDAMADYQRSRDQHALPMYELTCQQALLEPPPPEMQRLIGAIRGNQGAMDAFAQMNAGTISPAEFMSLVGAGEGGAGPSATH